MILQLLLVVHFAVFAWASHGYPYPRKRAEIVCLEAAKNTSWDPLCASDGQTFQNFLSYRCYKMFFNVAHLDARPGICAASPHPNHCALAFVVWRRVCGDDNVTYSSVWELMCEAQRQRKELQVQYLGPCRQRCPMSVMYRPVCGSDGVDYPNEDALACASMRNHNISLAKEGPCEEKDPLEACRATAHDSSYRTAPLCASNGLTYSSYQAFMCVRRFNTDLRILHDGPCTLTDLDMDAYAPTTCYTADNTAIWMPVCASDNQTYPNPFVFYCSKHREEISKDVSLEREGECAGSVPEPDPCAEAAKVARVIDKPLLCASDGRTYYSSKQYSCAIRMHGDWFPYSIVRVGMPCDASDTPCERLRTDAEALVASPMCGTDGDSYANPLALMCAMSTHPTLSRLHIGACLSSPQDLHATTTTTTTTITTTTESQRDPSSSTAEPDVEYTE